MVKKVIKHTFMCSNCPDCKKVPCSYTIPMLVSYPKAAHKFIPKNCPLDGGKTFKWALVSSVDPEQPVTFQDAFKAVPKIAQSQASLKDQLNKLLRLANKFGLYDAADYLTADKKRSEEYREREI